MSRKGLFLSLWILPFVLCGTISAETWQNVQRLNDVSETTSKTSRVFGSSDGGFHSVYIAGGLKYRRFQNGALGPIRYIAGGTIYNPGVVEAGNGDIHVVWEGWSIGLNVGWAKSIDGGLSFLGGSVTNNYSKYPAMANYGPSGSGTMVLTAGSINYPNPGDNNMNYATYNGSSWNPTLPLTGVDSEYNLEGICRSPVDGSVWKTYNASDERLYIRRFNGSSWEAPILIEGEQTFRCRHGIAVNDVGDIMVMWSKDDALHFRVYSPSSGVGNRIDFASKEDLGRVVAIPGHNAFYVIYADDQKRIKGRRYFYGNFDPSVLVSNGLPDGFYPDTSLSVSPDGTLCCSFEYWENGSPQQFYSLCTDYRERDTTAPVFNGPVIDDGSSQEVASYLHTTWTAANDPEGVHHYEYSIGTSSGLNNIVDWTNNGPGLEMLHTGSFSAGTYYINVRAVNNGGLSSEVRSSDGITINVAPNPGQFSSATSVGSTGSTCANVMLTKAGDGGLHMVYDVTDPSVYYRKRTSSGTWDTAFNIASGKFPDVVEDTSGNLHCVYTTDGKENLTLSEAVKTGMTWGSSAAIASGMNWYPRVASGSAGKVHLLDNAGSSHTVKFTTRDGSWSSFTDLGTSSRYGTPDIAMGSDGIIRAVWISGSDLVYRAYNGSWSSPVIITSGAGIMMPRIALDSANNPVVVWLGSGASKGYMIMFSRFDGSSWSTPRMLGYGHYPSVAVDASNNIHVVWAFYGNSGKEDIAHTAYTRSQWTDVVNVSNNAGVSIRPAVEVTNDGSVHIAWQDDTATGLSDILYTRSSAQVTTGSISGVVKDRYGNGMSGATVTVNPGNRIAFSGTNGIYSLAGLAPGSYSVTASKLYHTPQTKTGIQVVLGQSTACDLTLYEAPASPVTAFTASASDGIVRLNWTNPTNGNFAGTLIKVKTTGYPSGPADGTFVCQKTAAPGSVDSFTHTGLTNGVTYYYAAFAYTSSAAYSSAVIASAVPASVMVAEARIKPENAIIDMSGKVVTAVFASEGCIYIQEENGRCGIRVDAVPAGVEIGHKVNVVASKVTTVIRNGVPSERRITGGTVSKVSTTKFQTELAMMDSRALGGGQTAYFQGVQDGVGINSIGLLVKMVGKVVKKETDCFFMDDGAGVINALNDGTYQQGVKVKGSLTGVMEGDIVSVVGVAVGDVPGNWSANCPSIQVRSDADIIRFYRDASKGSIQGYVKDTSNNPIVGATVSTSTGGYTTTSASDGWYSLDGVAPGIYTVMASRSGYNPQSVSNVEVAAGVNTTADFNLTAQPGTISGYVRSSSGTILSGAAVVTNAGGYSATSNSSGYYVISNVTPGTYNLTASNSGYLSKTNNGVVVNPGGSTASDFSLNPEPQEKLLNGNFEGSFLPCGWWAGNYPVSWGFAWRGSPVQNDFRFDGFTFGGTHSKVAKITVSKANMEAGWIQVVSNLTPGANYSFSAQAYQFSTGSTVWIAADPNGGTAVPSRAIGFDNITGQWNSKTVTGTVGSGGKVSVFIWVWNQSAIGDVYVDNASLLTW